MREFSLSQTRASTGSALPAFPSLKTLQSVLPAHLRATRMAPLTPMQQDLYLGSLSAHDRQAFSVGMRVTLGKEIEPALWQQAVAQVVAHDDVPQTVVCTWHGQLWQVATNACGHCALLDARSCVEDQPAFADLITSQVRVHYDLGAEPAWRNALLLDGNGAYHALVAAHHLLSDGSGLKIFLARVCAIYDALHSGCQPDILPEFPSFYQAVPQIRARFDTPAVLSYWREQLRSVRAFPIERHASNAGRRLQLRIAGEQLRRLQAWCGQAHWSLPTCLRGLYAILLRKLSPAGGDLVMYNLLDGRSAQQAQTLGCFYQILPVLLPQALSSGETTVQQVFGLMRAYRKGPGEQQYISTLAQRHLLPQEEVRMYYNYYNFGSIPLQNTLLDFHDYDYYGRDEVHLVVHEKPASLDLSLYYDQSTFDDPHFLTRLQALAEQIIGGQEQVAALDYLLPGERVRLQQRSSAHTSTPLPQGNFAQRFARQVASTPDAIAVADGDQQVSYALLHGRALQGAAVLRARGVGTECLVALLAERSIEFLGAMLSIFQAGAAYLPLSPLHPPGQLSLVLARSRAALVVSSVDFQPLLAQACSLLPTAGPPQLLLSDLQVPCEQRQPSPGGEPASLAYVIYTSGSTGEPKGAMIEQRGMLNHLTAKIADLCLAPGDTVAQNVAQSFDVSVWQFLAALLAGARVQIISEGVGRDPLALLQHAERYQVTVLETVPSLLQGLFQLLPGQPARRPTLGSLRWLMSTGEALSADLAARWLGAYPRIPLMNGYGPTECSDDVSHGVCPLPPLAGPATVPIGRAIANLDLFVLDASYVPVPPGRSGELYIGGVGVGRGYLHQPEQTAERFVPDPFGREPGARLYRSGDLVRTLPDGSLEFLGRIDTQVKLRGYRIELSEIEAALNSQPGVDQSVVLLREDQPTQPRLVAYLVIPEGSRPARAELVAALRERLPEYMIPSAFLFLDAFPLTAHGKIHRRALPAPLTQHLQFSGAGGPAADSTAGRVAALWSQELGVEEIGLQSNFLALGGNSLSAIHVLTRIKEVFQIELSLRALFTASTLAEIAAQIDEAMDRKGSRYDVGTHSS